MIQTVEVTISGKVQGVFFRKSTLQQAVALDVTGSVRNLPDGKVRVVATASAEQLKAFLSWCRKGPAGAVVKDIRIEQLPVEQFADFSIER